jgi:hypothetical protein
MIELDVLSHEIDALMAAQRDAWHELSSPTLTAFDRRELRNRIRQSQVELREHLKVRTDRLQFRPRVSEAGAGTLTAVELRLLSL